MFDKYLNDSLDLENDNLEDSRNDDDCLESLDSLDEMDLLDKDSENYLFIEG